MFPIERIFTSEKSFVTVNTADLSFTSIHFAFLLHNKVWESSVETWKIFFSLPRFHKANDNTGICCVLKLLCSSEPRKICAWLVHTINQEIIVGNKHQCIFLSKNPSFTRKRSKTLMKWRLSKTVSRVEHCGKALFLKWSFLRVGGLKREAF